MASVRSDTERAPDAIPPERVSAGALVLRRPVTGDAEALARAVEESLEHLHPWMPWATPDAANVEAQRERLARVWDNDAGAPGIERVEIHCDEANRASAAVPRRLGYRLDRIEEEAVTAPAETGRTMVWVTTEPPRLSSGS